MELKGKKISDAKFLLELYRKAQSLHEKDLYEYFLDHAVNITLSEIGFFHFISNDQKTLILTTWNKQALRNCTANYATHYSVGKAGNWADAVRLKKPIIYNDFINSPHQKGLPEGHVPIKRILSIPIVKEEKVQAIFGVGNKSDDYTKEDILHLEFIGSELTKILKQRRVENDLLESEEKYRALFANMHDGFAYCQILRDEMGKLNEFICLDVNDAFENLMNVKKGILIGKKATEVMPLLKTARPYFFEKLDKVACTGVNEKYDFFVKSTGKWLSISLYSPKKGYFAAVVADITERKKAEEALKESEERLQLKLDSLLSPDVETDDQELANIIDVSALQVIMNYLSSVTNVAFALIDLKGKVLVEVGWQDICTRFHRINSRSCKNCIESDIELTKGLKKGEIRLYKCKNNLWDVVTPLFVGDKHVSNVFFGQFFFDDEVPDRKLFEAQAEKFGFDKKQYLDAFDDVPRFNRAKMQSLMLFYVNLAESFSKISHSNLKLAKALHEQKEMQNKIEEQAAEVEEYADQMERLAEERAKQLKDAERLSAIGATAGMVGHDIRNPLQAITNQLYLTKKKIYRLADEEARQSIQNNIFSIDKNLHYINKIVADLQDYARPLDPKYEQLNVEDVIRDALAVIFIPENIEKTLRVQTDIPPLKADNTMIKRILINLTQNAIQAMPNGGRLNINASFRDQQIEIAIQDTGTGIPVEVQPKLFTPLITTKAKGQGFGLAVVKRMTDAMGGRVTFESQEGKGSKFILKFPLSRFLETDRCIPDDT